MRTFEFQCEPTARPLLEQAGLNSFQSLMQDADGAFIHRGRASQVLRLSLIGPGGTPVTAYLKRTLHEKPRHALQMMLRGLRPHVESYREMQGTRLLRDRGFRVLEVMAWGEERLLGFPLRGFLLSREVKGQDAQEVFRSGDPATRCAVLQALGDLHGRLNAAGFYQALRFKDVFLNRSDPHGPFQTTLIDRSGLWVWPKFFLPTHHCRVSLRRSAWRLSRNDIRLNDEERRIYAEAYARAMDGRSALTPEQVAALLK